MVRVNVIFKKLDTGTLLRVKGKRRHTSQVELQAVDSGMAETRWQLCMDKGKMDQ